MKKKIGLIVLVLTALCVCFAFAGCSTEFDKYDDDAYIATSSNNIAVGSFSSNMGGATTWNISGGFGGVRSLDSVTVAASETLSVTLEYISGKFKLVAISTDKTVYILIENKSCDGELMTTLAAGTYNIKAVGSEAVFNMTYKL